MAKIVTVHGTFAHIETSSAEAETGSSRQWWQIGSDFERQLKKLIDSDGSSGEPGTEADFHNFIWNGENSELARRKAASRLLSDLKALEAHEEKYCIIAHSHGGSVVSSALQEAAAKGIKLEGLKRWVTVGTPFLELRPERHLFLRLPLLLKALFVASMMLLFMFLFYVAGELFDGRIDFDNQNQLNRLVVSTILTALPSITFYIIAWYFDRRQLFFYQNGNKQRTRKLFGDRWLPLTHEDDEAVSGLASVSSTKLKIFHKDFAVPTISLLSVFILPIVYLWVILSPSTMVSIADFLKLNVYRIEKYQNETQGVEAAVKELRQYRRKIRQLRADAEQTGNDIAKSLELKSQIRKLREQRRKLRETMADRFPNVVQIRRAQRFGQRFLEQRKANGEAIECNPTGQLCGEGKDILLNAKLLFHLVTDEVARWVVDRSYGGGLWWWTLHSVIPVLLVPVVFGIAAIAIVLIFQFLGRILSRFLSGRLDQQTSFEIRRSALGNDTETEVAVMTTPSPSWLGPGVPFIPPAVGRPIAERSNKEMEASISRIRSAISEFAVLHEKGGQLTSALNYLTWRELIHTSYFNVLEFQKLISCAIAHSDGFQPSATFKSDPEFDMVKEWLHHIEHSKAS